MIAQRDILITTTKERVNELLAASKKKLKNNGFQLIYIPTIKITPVKNFLNFQNTLSKIDCIDIILLTSQYAVQIFVKKIKELQALASFSQKSWLVIGQQTKQKLKTALPFVSNIFTPKIATTESLINLIRERQLMKNYFWFPCSNLSSKKIADFVDLHGGKCTQDVIYCNTFPLESEYLVKKYFTKKLPCWVVFTSPSSFLNFIGVFAGKANILQNIKIATIGETTAKIIRQKELKVHFVAKNSIEYLCDTIISS